MQQWDFHGPEARDGVRFSWNVWPTTRLEATRLVAPLGALYTPLKRIENMPDTLPYTPVRCSNCTAVLNPFSTVDFVSKLWTCALCGSRNHFPPHYSENISEHCLPAELIPQFTTVEYEMPSPAAAAAAAAVANGQMGGVPTTLGAAFMFVVDVCVEDSELAALRDALLQTIHLLPPTALVGLVSFGTLANIHELGFAECPKSFAFRGEREYASPKVLEMLGVSASRNANMAGYGQQMGAAPNMGRGSAIGRFLVPAAECAATLESILEDLQRDPWPSPTDERPQRCTGTALSLAMTLLEAAVPRQGSRIMLFTAGPATIGAGAIAARSKRENIRSYTDLERNQAPLHKPACEFYKGLAERAMAASVAVDLFACSLDQMGALEMKQAVSRSGGLMVLADKFDQSVFRESLRRAFERVAPDNSTAQAMAQASNAAIAAGEDGAAAAAAVLASVGGGSLAMGFGAQLEVLHSRGFKTAGAIGSLASAKKSGPNVSEVEIGVGGTSAWYLGGLEPSATVAVYFDVSNTSATPLPQHKRRFIQFLTNYTTAEGSSRLRVTTVCGLWHQIEGSGASTGGPNQDDAPLAASFDQEAATALLARLSIHRCLTEESADVIRWLDRSLIRLSSRFATYRKDDPSSFRLPAEFALLPQFMFHLRRSKFLQNFNSSPDEQAYYRHCLYRETTAAALIMIQPSLLSYSFNGPPTPALLDATSVRGDTILLLDSFFHLIVFHGETIAGWKQLGYQNQPEYASFRELLEAPRTDAQAIMRGRFPLPRYIVCDQHKSEARFLVSMLNPSVTHHSADAPSGQTIFTDDVSLRVFMEHLMKLAVQA